MELDVQAVRLAMVNRGFNITSLAIKTGLSPATIHLWLNHGTKPRLDKIGILAKALNVPLTAIIKNVEV